MQWIVLLLFFAADPIAIDRAWLDARKPPYILDVPNSTYQVPADVTVDGTAFVVGAANVTLDGTGHKITFGNGPAVVVRNGGFEDGLTGWDTSRCQRAVLKVARIGMWGKRVFYLQQFTTPQILVSDPIQIPTANREYAAFVTPKGTFGATVTLSIIDASTGAVVPSTVKYQSAPDRGFAPVILFTPKTTNPIRLRITMTPPAGKSAEMELDYAAVVTSRDYGVIASPPGHYLPPYMQTPANLAAVARASNFTLRNVSIVQGQAKSYGSMAINVGGIKVVTVDNVKTFVNGTDSLNLDGLYANKVTITNSTMEADIDCLTSRMQLCAAIRIAAPSGDVILDGNTILNYPQSGIVVSQNSGGILKIRNNKISQRAIVTDGYGIHVGGVKDFEFANNTGTPVSGRGMLFDSWGSAQLTQNGDVHDNNMSSYERPNLENPATQLEATALRVRNWGGVIRNVNWHDNVLTATTDNAGAWCAVAVRIDHSNANGLMNGANNRLENNVITAITTNTVIPSEAWGVSIASSDPGTGLLLANNTIRSNSIPLNISDTYNTKVSDITFISNTLSKLSIPSVKPFITNRIGYFGLGVKDVRLIDTRYAAGTPAELTFNDRTSQTSVVGAGWLLNMTAVDHLGSPLPGTITTVADRDGKLVYSGITDDKGKLSAIPLVTQTYTKTGVLAGQPIKPITIVPNGPFTVSSTSGIKTVTQSVDVRGNTDLSVEIDTRVERERLFVYWQSLQGLVATLRANLEAHEFTDAIRAKVNETIKSLEADTVAARAAYEASDK